MCFEGGITMANILNGAREMIKSGLMRKQPPIQNPNPSPTNVEQSPPLKHSIQNSSNIQALT